jgi:DNA-binding response OmpR family regulator
MRVLLVEDDAETRDLVAKALARAEIETATVADAAAALREVANDRFDVIVLDIMLGASSASGLELCALLRKGGLDTPILFLSARGAVRARVEGLEVGADDYLPKPFALTELLARVRSLARRAPPVRHRSWRVGELRLELHSRRALVGASTVPVTAREWEVLRVLAEAQGAVVSFDELLDQVWGASTERARASLDVIVSRLRKKLDAAAGRSVVRTVRGAGLVLERGLDGAVERS